MVYVSKQDSASSDVVPSFSDHVVSHPIDGTLDLHTFRPSDIPSLVPEYISECRQKGIRRVRIIHGKGSGHLRKSVQSILKKMPEVMQFRDASHDEGGWGATIALLEFQIDD